MRTKLIFKHEKIMYLFLTQSISIKHWSSTRLKYIILYMYFWNYCKIYAVRFFVSGRPTKEWWKKYTRRLIAYLSLQSCWRYLAFHHLLWVKSLMICQLFCGLLIHAKAHTHLRIWTKLTTNLAQNTVAIWYKTRCLQDVLKSKLS